MIPSKELDVCEIYPQSLMDDGHVVGLSKEGLTQV